MAKAQISPDTTLQVKRTFAAPRERVFRAWTEPTELAQWFRPTPDHRTVVPEMELRVGGRYAIEIHHKGGNVHKVSGTYREIKAPEKIVFSWAWEHDRASESVVTVEFFDLGPSTEVSITHEQLPSTASRDQHIGGWTGCFDQFAQYLSK